MAVKVITKVNNENRAGSPAQHGNGTDIDVRDGHLVVIASEPTRRVAIYAPGTWVSAEVTK